MSSNINKSELQALTELQGSVEHTPLFNRRPIPSPAEQPSRYAPTYTEIHSQGAINAMANNNGSMDFVRQPLPTISWICSCPNCLVSAQSFIKTIQNSNGMYTATICAAGPIYNQLLAATAPTYATHNRFEKFGKGAAKGGLLKTPNNLGVQTANQGKVTQALVEGLPSKERKSSNDSTQGELNEIEMLMDTPKKQPLKEEA